MQDNNTPFKEKLLETISQLRERGINLEDTPALFEWTYPEEPQVLIQVMLSKVETTETLQ